MKSSDFKEQLDIAGVLITPKMKWCGKENCRACPHGPFWYATAPGYWTVANHDFAFAKSGRMEVYLGRAWVADDLLGWVAPRLALRHREPFVAWIWAQLDRERLVEIGKELEEVASGRAMAERDLQKARLEYRRWLKDLARQESALKRERAALSKKLANGGKTVIIGRGL